MGYFAIPPFFNFCTMAEEKEKNMFEISGGEVDRDQLLDIVAKNADGYAQWRLQRQPGKNAILKKNRQDAFNVDGFHKALNDITTAISEGKLKRGAGNVYIHSDGVVWEDPEHRAALDLVNRGIDTIGKAQPKEKKKYSKTGLFDRFNNKFYGGNFTGSEQDWEIWKNNPESVNNVIKLLNEEYDSISNDDEMDYTDSPYKDRAEHLQRISKLRQNLANGVDESDYSDWVALGGDGEFFRNVTGLKKAEKSELETKWEAVATAMREAGYDEETIANRKEQFYKQEQNRLNAPFYDYDYNENWNKFASTNWSKRGSTQLTSLGSDNIDDSDWKGKYENEALNKPGWIEREGNASYADQLYKRAISGSFVDGSRDGYSNKQILRLYMNDQLEQDPQQFTTINQDSYFINSTFDLDSGTGIAYNKKTNTFTRVHVDPNNTPILLGKLKEMYLKKNPYNPSHTLGEWGSFKKTGGKLSKLKELRNGGNITYALSGAELAQRNKERRTSEYKQSVAERAQQQGVSEDVILARDVAAKDDNSFNSALRWVGTGFDVLGAGLSFVPVIGNALGAASGTIGTGLNLAADAMDDSVTSEEMWTNLGLNAAMTGLMLIPGGGTASIAGKALKTAKALVPAGASAYAGYQVASNWDRIKELEGKRKKGELSHAEFRELQMYASMAAGSVTGAKHTAAQAAPTVSKVSKTAGKITAGIADPIPGVQALFGNKKAKGVINSMTKDLKAPTIKVTDSKDGPEITFTDSNGKTFKLNADQEKAMTAIFNKGRKEGWSGEKLNEELGKAWANNHDDKTVWYRRDSKDAVTENIQKKWDLNADNEGAKGVLTSTKDPDGNTEIAGITFSKDSVKTLKEAYKQAADDFKSKNSSLPEEELNLQAHSKGIEAAKKKFADLSESVEQKVVQDAVEGTLNPDAPVFGMQDLSKWDKFKNRFGIKDTLNIDKETSSSSWFGPGNAYKFDPNYAVGRGNIAARVKQRNQAQGYLGDNQVANWALDHFNTNWEMAQGMSGIRTRTDRVLDAQSARRTAMASPKGQSKLRKQNIRAERNDYLKEASKYPEGRQVIRDLEASLGRAATDREKIIALKKADLEALRETRALRQELAKQSDPSYIARQNAKADAAEIKAARKLIPEWDKALGVSDEDIISTYNVAKSNGFKGSLSEYAEHLLDVQRLESARLGRPVPMSELWKNDEIKFTHNLSYLTDGFADSRAAVDLARSKYGMSGSDMEILEQLNSPGFRDRKSKINTEITNSRELKQQLATFKESLKAGPAFSKENKALIDNYRRSNGTAVAGKSDDEIIQSALNLRNSNQTILDRFLAKNKELSQSQKEALNDMVISGKRISEGQLRSKAAQVKVTEDAIVARDLHLRDVNSIFDGDSFHSSRRRQKLRQNIDKELESRGITNPRWRDRQPLVEAMKERMYEAYLKNKNRRASRKPKASLGMKLQRLQEIRMGFIQDNSHSSNELSKFARGGIIKAQWGSDSSKWFEDSFDQKYLTGWNESLDASKAGESLNTNPSHSKYGTLQGAYEANQAYTGNSNLVGQDLNTYYNNRYKDYNLQAYIDAYNKDAKTISDRWTRNHSYGDTGATAHNQLFKAMFANRSGNTNEAYDLGYSDSSQDIQGSTTWMRRMDRYNKKWNDSSLTDDERKKRIHEITLGDGSKGYVYKENDGTIGVVDNDTLNKLGYTTKTEDTKQPEESSTGATRSTSSIGSTTSAGSTGDAGHEATTDNKFSKIGKQWQDGVPQLLAASRLALNLRNNKKLANLAKKKGVALLSPIQMHKNVYGDFAALMSGNQQGSEIRSAANRIAEKTADADRASLMQLEGEIKSHAPEQEGRLRDNAAITKSREEQWELAQKVYDYNHKAADENMGRLVAKNNADIDMDMGLAAANTTNWNNFLSGLENDTRIKNADQKAKNYQLYQQYIQDWATSQIEDEHYQQLKDKYAATSDSKVYDELKKYKLQKTREIEPKLRQMRYNLLQGNYDMSVFDTSVGDYNMNGGYQMKLKKGGTVKVDSSRMKYRADDLRELRKQIRHNIETNRKALDNLSKATLLELKKMMGI